MVDTCAGEFAADTPYFYSCLRRLLRGAGASSPRPRSVRKRSSSWALAPSASGRASSSTTPRFTACGRSAELGYEVIIVNNNPETVSTDYDTADRLYFEPLTKEDVLGRHRGGKAHRRRGGLRRADGHQADQVPRQPRASAFSAPRPRASTSPRTASGSTRCWSKFRIKRPKGTGRARRWSRRSAAAERIGYPVLLRPSYVIGGQNMTIAYDESDVARVYGASFFRSGIENPVLVDKYMTRHRAGGGRHLRRHRRAHPRHYGAHRARRRPQRRLHCRLPALQHLTDKMMQTHRGLLRKAGPVARARRGWSTSST